MTICISTVRSSENHLIEVIDISWEEVVKSNAVQYTGTCPKCGKFVSAERRGGERPDECPMKYRGPRDQPSSKEETCPMKI